MVNQLKAAFHMGAIDSGAGPSDQVLDGLRNDLLRKYPELRGQIEGCFEIDDRTARVVRQMVERSEMENSEQ